MFRISVILGCLRHFIQHENKNTLTVIYSLVISKEICWAKHEYMNILPPYPIKAPFYVSRHTRKKIVMSMPVKPSNKRKFYLSYNLSSLILLTVTIIPTKPHGFRQPYNYNYTFFAEHFRAIFVQCYLGENMLHLPISLVF